MLSTVLHQQVPSISFLARESHIDDIFKRAGLRRKMRGWIVRVVDKEFSIISYNHKHLRIRYIAELIRFPEQCVTTRL